MQTLFSSNDAVCPFFSSSAGVQSLSTSSSSSSSSSSLPSSSLLYHYSIVYLSKFLLSFGWMIFISPKRRLSLHSQHLKVIFYWKVNNFCILNSYLQTRVTPGLCRNAPMSVIYRISSQGRRL
jgi:hypothetical protein